MEVEQISRINTAIYLLSLPSGPLFDINEQFIHFLMQAIELTLREKNVPPLLPINLDGGSFFAATPTARKILGLDGNPIDVIDDHNYPFTGTYQVKMRVVTIGLIWAYVTASPVLLSKDGNLRNQCISLCCKSLTAVSRDVVDASRRALQTITTTNESLPNELLKKALRPVLKNLAKFDNLTPALDALGHVLELLSKCFNKALGKQLIEHLKQWAEPDQIILARKWERGKEPEVASKIVALFEYLPSSITFITPLVDIVIDLESKVHKYRARRRDPANSKKILDVSGCGYAPFRSSLCAYLSRFPAESVNHFMNTDRLRNPKYVRLFLAILRLPEAEVLRAELKSKENVDKIVERLFCYQSLRQKTQLRHHQTSRPVVLRVTACIQFQLHLKYQTLQPLI